MMTSAALFGFIGALLFKSAISAAINYEPIKITVNENYNGQPDQVFPELQSLEPGVVHQGANFYFKPQLNLPSSYIPSLSSHIEALMSFIQQHHNSYTKDTSKIVVEKDKLIEVLKPFMYPLSDISKDTLSEIVLENENDLETFKPPKIISPGLVTIPKETTSKIKEMLTKPLLVPIVTTDEPKPMTSEIVVIPEAPELPSLPLNGISPVVNEKVRNEESIILEESTEPKLMNQELLVIPEAPVLPPLSFKSIPSFVEEVKKEESIILKDSTGAFTSIPEISIEPIPEPIITDVGPKLITQELEVIPEAPVLPSLSLNNIPSVVEEEVKNVESVILEESKDELPIISEISARPETVIINVEPKAITSNIELIPEAPVLPPLSLHDISSVVKEVKKKEATTLEESTGVFPTIPEISVRATPEPVIINVEPKSITSEIVVIPEAPVLPPLSLNGIPPIVEEEVKKEESIILEDSTGVFTSIPEISIEPIPESIILNVEPEPVIQELEAIPEAPVLPLLSFNNIPSVVEEEVKNVESIILEESTDEFPTISEISTRPETDIINVEPKPINSDIEIIPEAPVLPPLPLRDIIPVVEVKKGESTILYESANVSPPIPEISAKPMGLEQIIIDVEPKQVTSDLVVIPEAPVLPPLSFNAILPTVEEEVFASFPEISEDRFRSP